MALSGLVPWGVLPAWMYHAQLAPPSMKFNPAIAGLTWVDLVFPFFLFSMGAAIPLALGAALARGASPARLALSALRRGVALLLFALLVQHAAPHQIDPSPDAGAWALALLAFALMFPAFARLPARWPAGAALAVRVAGWAALLAWAGGVHYRDGGGLTLEWTRPSALLADINSVASRSDIIIVVLANTVVSGSLVWLCTRENAAGRVLVMLALIALRLSKDADGWVQDVWRWSPIPSLCQLYFQQYLLVVLPGTIAGDVLHRAAVEPRAAAADSAGWGRLAVAMSVLIVGVLVGLQGRWLPGVSVAAAIVCGLVSLALARGWLPRARGAATLWGWSATWLLLGLLLEPYEGGIRKDPHTLSYAFAAAGLAGAALIACVALVDGLRWRGAMALLTLTGANPMLAYAAIRGLLGPLVHLSGLEALVQAWLSVLSREFPFSGGWPGVAWAMAKTSAMACAIAGLTRLRVAWRA